MSVGATEAMARIVQIQRMTAVLAPTAGTPATGFDAALTAAGTVTGGAALAGPGSGGAGVQGVPFAAEINAAAAKHGVDPALLAGLVKQESGFDPQARSSAGATGLTQLMPATARGLGVSDATDPAQALDGGAKYLREQLDRFGGDERLALAAYNAGPGAVQRFGGVPPYSETQRYVERVLANRDEYAAGAPQAPASSAAFDTSSNLVAAGSGGRLPYPTT